MIKREFYSGYTAKVWGIEFTLDWWDGLNIMCRLGPVYFGFFWRG